MKTLWAQSGRILVDAQNRLVACDTCPCIDDCYASLILAIRKRQMATGRTVWAEDVEKTLAECITEVNAIAISFLPAAYTGGESAPSVCSLSYANSAADFCELYELTKLLTSSVVSGYVEYGTPGVSVFAGSREWSVSKDLDRDESLAAARAAVEADWPGSAVEDTSLPWFYNFFQVFAQQWYRDQDIGAFTAFMTVRESSLTITPPTADISRACRVFAYTWEAAVYDTYGYHDFTAQNWNLVWEKTAGTWDHWHTGYWPTANPPAALSPWPSDPAMGSYTTRGWLVAMNDVRVIIDWSFGDP